MRIIYIILYAYTLVTKNGRYVSFPNVSFYRVSHKYNSTYSLCVG